MKAFLFVFMLALPGIAEETYKHPHPAADKGYIELSYDEERGLTIHYPKSYKMKVTPRPWGNFYVSESTCDSYVKYFVDKISRVEDKSEREQQIEQYLMKDPVATFVVDYFPFYGDRFYDSIKSTLKENGISGHIKYRFPMPDIEVEKLDLTFKPGALTPLIKDIKLEDVFLKEDFRSRNYSMVVGSEYVPLACDILLGKVSFKIDWTLHLLSNIPIYHEPLSRDQVSTIYKKVKAQQDKVPNKKNSSVNERAFTLGMILANALRDEIGDLGKSDYANLFGSFFDSFVDRSSYSFKTLSSNELDIAHGSTWEAEDETISFKGVAHAK
tara:strand:+ start:2563 stop:3543 length:981 start_codon:yes stop_codon:yes gene_type:complete